MKVKILILFAALFGLLFASNALAADIEAITATADDQSGFSVVNSASDTLFRVRSDGSLFLKGSVSESTYPRITLFGVNGSNNAYLGSLSETPNNGYLELNASDTWPRIVAKVDEESAGMLTLYGKEGYGNIGLGYVSGRPDFGYISIKDSLSNTKVSAYAGSNWAGAIWTYGSYNQPNVAIGYYDDAHEGHVGGYNWEGNVKAAMYVNSSNGIVSADYIYGQVSGSRMSNPGQAGTDICYANLEGPEAGAYTRGTAQLVNGYATITFPDHFRAVSAEEGMTVSLVPLSAESKGLAVVYKSLNGVEIRELFDGKGNYDFDWEVKCVRQGHEEYDVIRSHTEVAAPAMEEPVQVRRGESVKSRPPGSKQ